jgi:NADP-dependent 3-hydroxy acid dehydrogenase YdfG
VGVLGSALDLKDDDLDRMLDTNLKGLFYLAKHAIPVMVGDGGGQIIVPVGILGRHVMRNSAGYSASKFGVVGLVRALGEEFNRRGMRFLMLYLGGVDTNFWDGIDMKVQRDKMLSPGAVAETIIHAMGAPAPAVVSEIVMQPDSHQFV